MKRFQLKSDENAVYIVYYGQEYRIDRINGMITLTLEPEQKLSFNTVISIYNLFYYAKPDAKVRGNSCPSVR